MNTLMTLISTDSKPANLLKGDSTEPKSSEKDFISILFSQIENHSKKSVKEEKKIPINIVSSVKAPIKEGKSKSSNELLLGDILNMLSILKGNDDKISFPKFSDKLDKILNNKSALNEFKNIKNLDDIFKISKRLNLGLKEISFTKTEIKALKKDFPKLDLQKFFETKTIDKNHIDNRQIQIIAKGEKYIITKKLTQNLPNRQNHEKPKDILQSILRDIDKETKKVIVKNIQEDKKAKVEKDIPKNKIVDNITIDKEIKETLHTAQKSVNKKTKNLLDNPKDIVQKKMAKSEEILPKKTVLGDVKQSKIETNKNISEIISHKIDIKKEIKTQNVNNINTPSIDNKSDIENTKDMKDVKIEPKLYKHEFINRPKVDTFNADKSVETKNSLNQFSNDLKDKIENYKPPIMKVKMALSPKNLGGVEVTLIHRGNNLHVNITSNTNTMSLFTQNQVEFKNSLVNMGFTNLEMNFSDQNQGKNNQQKNSKKQKNSTTFESINNQKNNESSLELIVPRYI